MFHYIIINEEDTPERLPKKRSSALSEICDGRKNLFLVFQHLNIFLLNNSQAKKSHQSKK